MTSIGAYSPENARLILDVVRYLKESGFIIEPGGRKQQFIPPEAAIYVRNDSGEEIPPFACLQTTGTVDTGGQNYITVDKPVDDTGAAGGYLFNGIAPIEIDGYGIAHDGPVARMLTDGSTVNCGDKWKPDIGEWAVIEGEGPFVAIGLDDIETDVMRAFITAPGGGGATIEYTISSLATASSGPYTGLKVATVVIRGAPCSRSSLIGTTASVVDHSGCIFDIEDMAGYTGWAAEMVFWSLDAEAACETATPCHWAAINRCCAPNSGDYAEECA